MDENEYWLELAKIHNANSLNAWRYGIVFTLVVGVIVLLYKVL